MKRNILSIFALAVAILTSGCDGTEPEYTINGPVKEEGDDNPDDSGEETGEKTLKDAPYLIGCTVIPDNLRNYENYRNLVTTEFSSITAENAMKMRNIWKARDSYDFRDTDFLVNFAENNGLRVHGHTLIWYKDTSKDAAGKDLDWLKQYDGQGEEVWKELLHEYISTVVGRYKGRIASWDVVNEAVNNNGTGFRGDDDIWYKNLGEDYIALAFQYAHEADPDAVLLYNDYGMEWGPTKRGFICELISDLKKAGVPVDGIGIQMHVDIDRKASDIKAAIDAAHDCGVMVHVSEMDVDMAHDNEREGENGSGDLKDGVTVSADDTERLEAQKKVFQAAAEALNALPAEDVYGFTTWGVRDSANPGASSLQYPLLFDSNYQKKPAYYGLTETF